METQHKAALAAAVDRANQSFLRQQKAAKNCVGGEKRREQLQASADKAEAIVKDLQAAVDHYDLLQTRLAAALQNRLGANLPVPSTEVFVGVPYRTDTGWSHPLVLDADGRLRIVPTLSLEQCNDALRRTDLQHVVRKALERRQRTLAQRTLAKAGVQ